MHALTRTRDLLCRSQALCHHATPFGTATTHIANATTRMKVMKKKKQHKNKRNNGIAITSSFPFFYFELLFQKINKDWETKK
jgi:hypothetical protein